MSGISAISYICVKPNRSMQFDFTYSPACRTRSNSSSQNSRRILLRRKKIGNAMKIRKTVIIRNMETSRMNKRLFSSSIRSTTSSLYTCTVRLNAIRASDTPLRYNTSNSSDAAVPRDAIYPVRIAILLRMLIKLTYYGSKEEPRISFQISSFLWFRSLYLPGTISSSITEAYNSWNRVLKPRISVIKYS
jgi:hypothetical protein